MGLGIPGLAITVMTALCEAGLSLGSALLGGACAALALIVGARRVIVLCAVQSGVS